MKEVLQMLGGIFRLLVLSAWVLVGCKDDNGDPSPYISMEEYLELYGDEYPGYKTTNSGLVYYIEEEGTGDTPEKGDVVSVHYTGYHLNDGKFDSSYDRGYPLSFTLGEGQVIQGWDEGIALLKKGGKATFFIPSYLGYGKDGGGSISSNEDLKFNVKLVDFDKK
ncbi:FKBP-type peptidyl-prolyl cis-trans isomerase [Reichenbachiella carrageenanivorans]|uniref:Peptidyl-prolyl cis-trans isomerase n=1 Tax=Reichenbachiella carrageenanivorans TaxID=2979869 RepID=A0ABY6D2B1_9BACT|nr:FKBP-type peptidyl-prolyl cis-trans isomerase [Reichenbachiella carrageenanivorans]UXX79755.1 FKBP-type peptidyl-prolyl cis-trans isomerase [Reichenbachiella carrageenanivorans]